MINATSLKVNQDEFIAHMLAHGAMTEEQLALMQTTSSSGSTPKHAAAAAVAAQRPFAATADRRVSASHVSKPTTSEPLQMQALPGGNSSSTSSSSADVMQQQPGPVLASSQPQTSQPINSSQTSFPPVQSVDDLEAQGAALLAQAGGSSATWSQKHPFVFSSMEGMTIADVGQLLMCYKELVLKYEMLVAALSWHQASATAATASSNGITQDQPIMKPPSLPAINTHAAPAPASAAMSTMLASTAAAAATPAPDSSIDGSTYASSYNAYIPPAPLQTVAEATALHSQHHSSLDYITTSNKPDTLMTSTPDMSLTSPERPEATAAPAPATAADVQEASGLLSPAPSAAIQGPAVVASKAVAPVTDADVSLALSGQGISPSPPPPAAAAAAASLATSLYPDEPQVAVEQQQRQPDTDASASNKHEDVDAGTTTAAVASSSTPVPQAVAPAASAVPQVNDLLTDLLGTGAATAINNVGADTSSSTDGAAGSSSAVPPQVSTAGQQTGGDFISFDEPQQADVGQAAGTTTTAAHLLYADAHGLPGVQQRMGHVSVSDHQTGKAPHTQDMLD